MNYALFQFFYACLLIFMVAVFATEGVLRWQLIGAQAICFLLQLFFGMRMHRDFH